MSAPEIRERDACLFFSLLQAKVGRSLTSRIEGLSLSEAMELSPERFASAVRGNDRVAKLFGQERDAFRPEEVRASLAERGLSLISTLDDAYPEALRETPDAPPALFVDGDDSGALPGGEMVAVVGSRKATVGALEVAESLGRALASRGVCVVSGLALGVDAAAHRGALGARGPTIGVLGCGIDVVYPRSNRDLFEKMKSASNAAIVSEYYLGEPPLSWRFPARNRIISGLSGALVVVEAAEKSGALITARHALEAGREVWAVPGPVGVPECRGSNRLLVDGANVLWDLEEFSETVAPESGEPERADSAEEGEAALPELPEVERFALGGVGFTPCAVDEISQRSGVMVEELLPALTLLQLKGYISRNANGSFVRRAKP